MVVRRIRLDHLAHVFDARIGDRHRDGHRQRGQDEHCDADLHRELTSDGRVWSMADNPRIEELRRRVLADPASIAFAALAEEYRRSGNYAEAIETCRVGLQRHPSYLSARVTLGRALIETAQYGEARRELELVL